MGPPNQRSLARSAEAKMITSGRSRRLLPITCGLCLLGSAAAADEAAKGDLSIPIAPFTKLSTQNGDAQLEAGIEFNRGSDNIVHDIGAPRPAEPARFHGTKLRLTFQLPFQSDDS